MPTRPRRPRDPNELAFQVFQEAIGEAPKSEPKPATVGATRRQLGGVKGGKSRAAKLSPTERTEIAKLAAAARWKKSDP